MTHIPISKECAIQRQKAFAKLLRDKEQWPRGFRWFFGNCRMCGMGLLRRVKFPEWGEKEFNRDTNKIAELEESQMASYLGLSPEQADTLFYEAGLPFPKLGLKGADHIDEITPERLATILESFNKEP